MSCDSQIHLSIQTQPLWPGYNISEFRMNAINDNDGMVLTQVSIPLNDQTNYKYSFNETLSRGVSQACISSVSFAATALSPVYGESMPSKIEVTLDRRKNRQIIITIVFKLIISLAPGSISDQSITNTCVLLPKWHSICLYGD